MNIKYDAELIGQMNMFEKITRAKLKASFMFREKQVFMVENGYLNKAIGKNKVNLLRIEKLLNRQIRVIEYNEVLTQFIQNLIAPLKVTNIVEEDDIVTITGPDTKTKGLMIGARAKNLRETETIVQRYFPTLKEIKVV